jgi:hypothetical protein
MQETPCNKAVSLNNIILHITDVLHTKLEIVGGNLYNNNGNGILCNSFHQYV